MSPESFPEMRKATTVEELVEFYGHEILRNPHYGRPGHEDDPPTMSLADTPEECPPLIETLLRAEDAKQQRSIIDLYKAKKE